ncbi:MAG: N-6 DNA methylase [Bacteroidaceae bacterium]|nr:N-6 DNA methylase [Bacteroidaceae bacterium]MBQ9175864.1 N-6 DNA methylase [Bacteroidaceae bacterium]
MNSSNCVYGERANGGGHGDVPTAPEVVRYMLDLVGYTADKNLSNIIILEPSCGEGEFVVEIAHRLMESALRFGFDAQAAFIRCVYGYDIVEEKIQRCRERIKELGLNPTDVHIRVGDFLSAQLHEVDVVVGNPPYVRYENIPASQIDYIKNTFPTFHYRSDLYIPFFEKTLRALKPSGKHCFICANRWLKNEYGRKLRRLIARCFRLESIINLERANAFKEDVLAYPAITLISNSTHRETFEYAEVESMDELANLHPTERNTPIDDEWSDAFIQTNYSQLYTIEELGFKIGIGVATGADNIFISSELPSLVEPELLLPALNAKDLRGDTMCWHQEYLLNPYTPSGELISLTHYPLAARYLESHRERLAERHVARKNTSKWYKTIDRINPQLKSEAKILLPDMSGNRYIFVDEGRFYPLHNLYYVIGHSVRKLKILSAILMSDIIRQQISSITNNMNGGFPRWQSQYLRKLKVPDFMAMEGAQEEQLIQSYDEMDFEAVNRQVCLLYNNLTSTQNRRTATPRGHAKKKQESQLELTFDKDFMPSMDRVMHNKDVMSQLLINPK